MVQQVVQLRLSWPAVRRQFGVELERSRTRDRYGYVDNIKYYDLGTTPYLAYAYSYDNERQRAQALPHALDSYNRYRPHHALGGQTPLQRVNDLSGTNS